MMKRTLAGCFLLAAVVTSYGAGLFRASDKFVVTNFVASTNTVPYAITNLSRTPFYMTSVAFNLNSVGTNNAYIEKVKPSLSDSSVRVTNLLFVASASNVIENASYPLAIWPILQNEILQVRHDATNRTVQWEVNTEYYVR